MKTVSTDVWTESDPCSIPIWPEYYGEKKVEIVTKKTRYIQMFVGYEGVFLAVSEKSFKDNRWQIEECDEVYDCDYETDGYDEETSLRDVCLKKAEKSRYIRLFRSLAQLIKEEQEKN